MAPLAPRRRFYSRVRKSAGASIALVGGSLIGTRGGRVLHRLHVEDSGD